MKKVYITFVAILLVVASVTTILSVRSHNAMDDFFRANVEVLSQTETGGKTCYNTFTNDLYDSGVYCGTCETLPGRPCNKSNCYK